MHVISTNFHYFPYHFDLALANGFTFNWYKIPRDLIYYLFSKKNNYFCNNMIPSYLTRHVMSVALQAQPWSKLHISILDRELKLHATYRFSSSPSKSEV